jgi:hypothetical protein
MRRKAIAVMLTGVSVACFAVVGPGASAGSVGSWHVGTTTAAVPSILINDGPGADARGLLTAGYVDTALWFFSSCHDLTVRWYGYQPATGTLGYSSWSYLAVSETHVRQYHNGFATQGNHGIDG